MKKTTTAVVVDWYSHYSTEMNGPSFARGAERALRGWIARNSDKIFRYMGGYGDGSVAIFDNETGEVVAEVQIRANFGRLELVRTLN